MACFGERFCLIKQKIIDLLSSAIYSIPETLYQNCCKCHADKPIYP